MNKYKKLRKEINISQAQLADILGVSQTAISQWETNKNYPDVGTLKTLAEIFCVSTDYLLDLDNTKIREDNEIGVYTRVPAGVDWNSNIDRDGTVELPSRMASDSREYIAFKAMDDALSPIVIKNDLLIIELTDQYQNGDLVLVQYSGYDAQIRYAFHDRKGTLIQPLKPGQKGFFFSADQKEQPRILGVVRELRRTMN